MTWKRFPHYWPFVGGIHRSLMNYPHEGPVMRTFGISFTDSLNKPWWRHQMETFSALLAICARNSPVPGEYPAQRPVTRSFDVFFDMRPNERLSKQCRGWWFETSSSPLWRHCNGSRDVKVMCYPNVIAHQSTNNALGHCAHSERHVRNSS